MNKAILYLAYFLIWTTPVQLLFLVWIYSYVLSVNYSLLSFSTADFMDLTFLRIVKAWMYSWFWNDFLDLVWGLPAAIMITLKLLVNAALGAWLLPVAKKLNSL
tara:strand:+ start:214 stop:525 length:312 start_codon:yes stop_codon:yes gene_type:complete